MYDRSDQKRKALNCETALMTPPFRTRAVRPAPPKIARAGADIVADLAQKTRFVDPNLAAHWPTIAGAEIARLCRPGRITGVGSGRTLEVYAPTGAAASELQYLADDLKTRINKYLGPGAISHVAIKQRSTKPPSPANAGNAPAAKSALDDALAAFRRSVEKKPDNS